MAKDKATGLKGKVVGATWVAPPQRVAVIAEEIKVLMGQFDQIASQGNAVSVQIGLRFIAMRAEAAKYKGVFNVTLTASGKTKPANVHEFDATINGYGWHRMKVKRFIDLAKNHLKTQTPVPASVKLLASGMPALQPNPTKDAETQKAQQAVIDAALADAFLELGQPAAISPEDGNRLITKALDLVQQATVAPVDAVEKLKGMFTKALKSAAESKLPPSQIIQTFQLSVMASNTLVRTPSPTVPNQFDYSNENGLLVFSANA